MIEHYPVANVEDGIAPVTTWPGPVGGEPVARRVTIGGGGTAVPSRAIINAVAVCIVHVEQQAVAGLFLQCHLQRVVIGVSGVLPNPQRPVVAVDMSARLATKSAPDVVLNATARGQVSSRNTVHVISAEQLVPGRPDVIHLERQLGHNLPLKAKEVVVNIRVTDTLRENDARQECGLRVAGSPTGEIAHGLRANALAGVLGRTSESWGGAARAAGRTRGVAGGWAVNDHRVAAVQRRTIR